MCMCACVHVCMCMCACACDVHAHVHAHLHVHVHGAWMDDHAREYGRYGVIWDNNVVEVRLATTSLPSTWAKRCLRR